MRRWRSGRPRTPPRSRRPSSSCSASSRPATWLCAPTTTKTSRSRSCRRMPTSSSSRCRWEAARRRMRFAVLGAGAIGAYVGAALARGGADVHLIARGDNLEAMQRRGVRVRSDRGDFEAHPPATDDPSEIGPVDFVFLGLKANSYAESGPLLEPLLHEDTAVVPAQNGIPWWYFHRLEGPYEGRRIEAVDPGGALSRAIPPERAIGCVAFPGTALAEPGVVQHYEGTRFSIGEPDGSVSERCRRFSEAMIAGGLKCPIQQGLRDHIWIKLMGNVAFNPLSILTRSTLAG